MDSISPKLALASPAASPNQSLASPTTSSEPSLAVQSRTPQQFRVSRSRSPSPIFHRFTASPATSPNLALGDQASSSRRKRQRVEEEDGGVEVIATEIPRNLLECPVCFNALTIPTFQCFNGHIACSFCCIELRNICPSCKLPTGKSRCKFAESLVEASIFPCPNAKHGCTQKFPYGKEIAHEKECCFALCYCPAPNCNYTGIVEDLYTHFEDNHNDISDSFEFGISYSAIVNNGMKNIVIQDLKYGLLVVIQGFKLEQGMNVTVNCIAPCAPEVGKFSYQISYKSGHHNIVFGPVEMNKIQKVSLQYPEKGSCMFVPDYFMNEEDCDLKMDLCIRQIVEEEEAEEGVEENDY